MGIKVIIRGDTLVVSKHGQLIDSVYRNGSVTEEQSLTKLVELAYKQGRDDMQYELERALEQLRSSD